MALCTLAIPAGPPLWFFFLRQRNGFTNRQYREDDDKTYLQALPLAFCHESGIGTAGLTPLDQTVVPVVRPEGFLSTERADALDTGCAGN